MCINFLDLTIKRKQTNLETDIYCKPTITDTTFNSPSNHPIEHKMAAFRYHMSRMHSLLLAPKNKQEEWELIQLIARKNNFPQNLLQKINRQIQHKIGHAQIEKRDNKRFGQHLPIILLI